MDIHGENNKIISTIADRLKNLYDSMVIANSVTNEFVEALPDCYEAVEKKGGTLPAQQTAVNLPEAIESIPSSGSKKELKDVAFIDYDGTILESYTYTELDNITELPEPPVHEGLTFLYWSETLQELKQKNHKITICGACYKTADNKFHVFITTPHNGAEFSFVMYDVKDVEWGDRAVDGSSGTNTYTHIFAEQGDYEIKISYAHNGAPRSFSPISQACNNMVTEMWSWGFISGGADNYSLASPTNFPNLKAIVFPESQSFISSNDSFINNINLKAVVCGNDARIGGSHRTWQNNGIVFQTRITASGVNKGINEIYLKRINFKLAKNNSSWKNLFSNNQSLEYIWIDPNSGIESMGNCFCYKEIHIPNDTVPSLGNTNYFSNIPTTCKIYVKTGLLSSYETATNWSTIYAQYIFVEED